MMIAAIWGGTVLLYILFRLWYGNTKGKLTGDELKTIEEWLNNGPEDRAVVRDGMLEFAKADDGHEFYMVNLIKLHEGEITHPDTGKPITAFKLLQEYSKPFMRAMFKRAGHPSWLLAATGGYADAANVPADPGWTTVGIVRYRSRRDMFAVAMSDMFKDTHGYKLAAMAATFAIPTSPRASFMAGPRGVVLLVLALGASLGTIVVMA